MTGKLDDVKLSKNISEKKNYNEVAKDVMNIINKEKEENQFTEFTEFLGNFVEMSIEKFGEATIINHMNNITLMMQLKQTGIIKVKE